MLHDYLNIELGIIALIILFLIFINTRHKIDKKLLGSRLYLLLLFLTAIIVIIEITIRVFNGTSSFLCNLILMLSTNLYYIFEPVIFFLLLLYIDYQINRRISLQKRFILMMAVPAAVNMLLTLLSIFGGYYYFLDSNHICRRGPLFLLLPIISSLYIIYIAIYVLINRRRIPKSHFLPYILLTMPTIIGILVQIFSNQVTFIWIGVTLSLLVIFMNIQNEQMYKDYLTGLFNRRQLDYYLEDLPFKKNVTIAGIMLDLNSFKHINDHYGHYTGDEALKHTSNLLQNTFGKNAFVSRFGGDEFVVFLEVNDRSDLDKAIQDLKLNIKQFNKTKELPYKLDFSIGADLYPSNSTKNGHDFLNYIDTLMYKDKHTVLQRN